MIFSTFIFFILLSHGASYGEKLRMKLFTPGPAVTSPTVKSALNDDIGFEEKYFFETFKYVTDSLLDIAALDKNEFVAVPMQGSGTYSNEAAIRTATPRGGNVLILSNGYFGEQLIKICSYAEISYETLQWEEGEQMNLTQIENHLKNNKNYSTVAMVHFETSTTMLNPLNEIGQLIKNYLPMSTFVVDAIGSFGCLPFDFDEAKVDFLTLAPHRCLQAFLGYGVVIARRQKLYESKDNCRSYVLNVYDQNKKFESTGLFRFTMPVQVINATKQGIIEYLEEGMENRIQRYTENRDYVRNGLTMMGFVPFIPTEYGSSIVTAFYWPNHVFRFSDFQQILEENGTFLYSTSLTEIELFRVGHIGNITIDDCHEFLNLVESALRILNVTIPMPRGPYLTKI